MSKILLVCEDTEVNNETFNLLNELSFETKTAFSTEEVFSTIESFSPDIALIDTTYPNLNISEICKKFKLQSQTNDIQIILITSENTYSEEIYVGADGYMAKPLNEGILIATINAHLRIKKLLDILYTNNSELAKSLYQLNVLYNISTQLAGTLSKTRLINIMIEGLEKSLNFSLCSALIINDVNDASLMVHSEAPISEDLEEALKLRALIGYKSLYEKNDLPFELSEDNITVEKYPKSDEGLYDLPAFKFDSLFSSINTSDSFFGVIEILREEEFLAEDSTYFQTVVKQVSMPLESAILYEEIKKTNEKLEKLEKLKSEFISIVSHELRTPLTSIKNSLDIMLSGKTGELSKGQDNFLSLAKRNVNRLSGIINDLLDLSKIEAGKMEYRLKPLSILEPIIFVKKTFENLAESKNINFSLLLPDEKIKIYGDVDKIEQVISNLISNALKFTPEKGYVSIIAEKLKINEINQNLFYEDNVDNHQLNLNSEYIKISVKDTGIGIREEDVPKVFDKFQQIENSLSREVGGTGLGLPIAKQLIEAHRGKIWVNTDQEKGTCFSFILPIMQHENIFLLELDNELHHAKHNNNTLALLTIKAEENILKDISSDKINLKDKNYKFKIFNQDDKIYFILMDTNNKNINSFKKLLKEKLIENNYQTSNLSLGKALFPKDAISSEELINISKKNMYNLK